MRTSPRPSVFTAQPHPPSAGGPSRPRSRSTWNRPCPPARAPSAPRRSPTHQLPAVRRGSSHVPRGTALSAITRFFLSTMQPHHGWSVRGGPAHVPRGTAHEHQHAPLCLHGAASSSVVSPWRRRSRSTWNNLGAPERDPSSPRSRLIYGGQPAAAPLTFHVEQPGSLHARSFIHLHEAASSRVLSPRRLRARSTWNSP